MKRKYVIILIAGISGVLLAFISIIIYALHKSGILDSINTAAPVVLNQKAELPVEANENKDTPPKLNIKVNKDPVAEKKGKAGIVAAEKKDEKEKEVKTEDETEQEKEQNNHTSPSVASQQISSVLQSILDLEAGEKKSDKILEDMEILRSDRESMKNWTKDLIEVFSSKNIALHDIYLEEKVKGNADMPFHYYLFQIASDVIKIQDVSARAKAIKVFAIETFQKKRSPEKFKKLLTAQGTTIDIPAILKLVPDPFMLQHGNFIQFLDYLNDEEAERLMTEYATVDAYQDNLSEIFDYFKDWPSCLEKFIKILRKLSFEKKVELCQMQNFIFYLSHTTYFAFKPHEQGRVEFWDKIAGLPLQFTKRVPSNTKTPNNVSFWELPAEITPIITDALRDPTNLYSTNKKQKEFSKNNPPKQLDPYEVLCIMNGGKKPTPDMLAYLANYGEPVLQNILSQIPGFANLKGKKYNFTRFPTCAKADQLYAKMISGADEFSESEEYLIRTLREALFSHDDDILNQNQQTRLEPISSFAPRYARIATYMKSYICRHVFNVWRDIRAIADNSGDCKNEAQLLRLFLGSRRRSFALNLDFRISKGKTYKEAFVATWFGYERSFNQTCLKIFRVYHNHPILKAYLEPFMTDVDKDMCDIFEESKMFLRESEEGIGVKKLAHLVYTWAKKSYSTYALIASFGALDDEERLDLLEYLFLNNPEDMTDQSNRLLNMIHPEKRPKLALLTILGRNTELSEELQKSLTEFLCPDFFELQALRDLRESNITIELEEKALAFLNQRITALEKPNN